MFKFFIFFVVLLQRVIETPLLRKANSLILFSKVVELNFIEENTSFEGKKFILVPLFLSYLFV